MVMFYKRGHVLHLPWYAASSTHIDRGLHLQKAALRSIPDTTCAHVRDSKAGFDQPFFPYHTIPGHGMHGTRISQASDQMDDTCVAIASLLTFYCTSSIQESEATIQCPLYCPSSEVGAYWNINLPRVFTHLHQQQQEGDSRAMKSIIVARRSIEMTGRGEKERQDHDHAQHIKKKRFGSRYHVQQSVRPTLLLGPVVRLEGGIEGRKCVCEEHNQGWVKRGD